jgi:hypothetical protein
VSALAKFATHSTCSPPGDCGTSSYAADLHDLTRTNGDRISHWPSIPTCDTNDSLHSCCCMGDQPTHVDTLQFPHHAPTRKLHHVVTTSTNVSLTTQCTELGVHTRTADRCAHRLNAHTTHIDTPNICGTSKCGQTLCHNLLQSPRPTCPYRDADYDYPRHSTDPSCYFPAMLHIDIASEIIATRHRRINYTTALISEQYCAQHGPTHSQRVSTELGVLLFPHVPRSLSTIYHNTFLRTSQPALTRHLNLDQHIYRPIVAARTPTPPTIPVSAAISVRQYQRRGTNTAPKTNTNFSLPCSRVTSMYHKPTSIFDWARKASQLNNAVCFRTFDSAILTMSAAPFSHKHYKTCIVVGSTLAFTLTIPDFDIYLDCSTWERRHWHTSAQSTGAMATYRQHTWNYIATYRTSFQPPTPLTLGTQACSHCHREHKPHCGRLPTGLGVHSTKHTAARLTPQTQPCPAPAHINSRRPSLLLCNTMQHSCLRYQPAHNSMTIIRILRPRTIIDLTNSTGIAAYSITWSLKHTTCGLVHNLVHIQLTAHCTSLDPNPSTILYASTPYPDTQSICQRHKVYHSQTLQYQHVYRSMTTVCAFEPPAIIDSLITTSIPRYSITLSRLHTPGGLVHNFAQKNTTTYSPTNVHRTSLHPEPRHFAALPCNSRQNLHIQCRHFRTPVAVLHISNPSNIPVSVAIPFRQHQHGGSNTTPRTDPDFSFPRSQITNRTCHTPTSALDLARKASQRHNDMYFHTLDSVTPAIYDAPFSHRYYVHAPIATIHTNGRLDTINSAAKIPTQHQHSSVDTSQMTTLRSKA